MMFQLFLSISDILGNVLLYVITNGMRVFAFLGDGLSVSSDKVPEEEECYQSKSKVGNEWINGSLPSRGRA